MLPVTRCSGFAEAGQDSGHRPGFNYDPGGGDYRNFLVRKTESGNGPGGMPEKAGIRPNIAAGQEAAASE